VRASFSLVIAPAVDTARQITNASCSPGITPRGLYTPDLERRSTEGSQKEKGNRNADGKQDPASRP